MLIRQTLIYSAGGLIPALIATALVALYTRALSAEQYGLVVLVITSVEFTRSLTLLWLNTAMIRLYPRQENKNRFLGAILTIFLSVVALVFLLCAVAIIFVFDTAEHRILAALGLLFFVATSWMEINSGLFSARLDARRSALIRISRSLCSGILAASLVLAGGGTEGVLLGAAVGMLVPGIFQILTDWRQAEQVGHIRNVAPLSAIGVPLAGGIAVGTLGAYAGRAIVTAIEGVSALGLYAIGAELAERMVTAILSPLNTAIAPLATHDLEHSGVGAARSRLSSACVLMIGIMAPATVGITLTTPDIVLLLIGDEFREVTSALLPLATIATMLFSFRAGYLDQALHLGMKQNYLFWREVIYLGVTVCSSLAFVSYFGVVGLGYAMVTTTSIMLLVTYVFARRAFPLPFPLLNIAKIAAATAIMGVIVYFLPIDPGWVGLIAKATTGALVYALLVIAFDVSWVRSTLQSLLKDWFDELSALRRRPRSALD